MTDRLPTVLDIEHFSYIPPSWEESKRAECNKKLDELFAVFERQEKGTCDVREVGNIARGMGLNPTEAQVAQMIEAIEEPESTGFVKSEKLRALLVDVVTTREFKGQLMIRDDEATIFRALAALDKDRKGYIDSEYLKELMTTMGEKFNTEEILEMINVAADPETGHIYYEDYASVLATE